MHTESDESLYFSALLILCGGLALYGGERWLFLLVPAAVVVWLVAAARCRARGAAIDARVDNRAGRALGR